MLWKYIKKILDDIIDTAYPDSGKRFKGYKLYLSSDEKTSFSGVYYLKEQKIIIYNMSLGARHVAKCCLHELSHHIDYIQNGKTGHQKPFYEAYAKLIYASLNMDVLTVEDFDDFWSSDRNKVKRIVEKYIPHRVSYKLPTERFVKVRNCYAQKDVLKANGYSWNNLEQVWEKETKDEDKEKAFLEQAGLGDYKIEEFSLYIDAVVYICAKGNTREVKEELKKLGFYFDKTSSTWKKKTKIKGKKLDELLVSLNGSSLFKGRVSFDIVKSR